MRKPGILVSCLITAFVLSPLAQAKTFKIATAAPEGTTWMKQIRQGAELIQKKTSGRVKFKFYTGGVMGSDKSVLKKMRIGQLHGGATQVFQTVLSNSVVSSPATEVRLPQA